MKPSSLRTAAMPTLRREAGIATDFFEIRFAFRMRVSMSATGSVIMAVISLPGRLSHAGDLAAQGARAQTDAAHAELPVDRARAAAQAAAADRPAGELRLALRLEDQARLGHGFSSIPPRGRACRALSAGGSPARRSWPSSRR